MNDALPLFAAAFTAGLLGTPHCMAMCGAFASACAKDRGGLMAWHLGRITTYSLLGAVAGAGGTLMPGPAWLPAALAAIFLVWFTAALAGLVPEPRVPVPGLAALGQGMLARSGTVARFGFGLLNGLLPCGLVYSALSLPVALANPVLGAVAMAAFGLGTLPSVTLAARGLRSLAARSLKTRRLLAALVLVLGLWSIGLRAGAFGDHLGHHHQSGSATDGH